MTVDEQIAEIDKTITMIVEARRILLAMVNVSKELKEKQRIDKTIAMLVKASRELKEKQSMEDCISRKQLYDSFDKYLVLKPPIELKE